MGFWDHWVPGANQASTDLVNEWAAKEKVEVSIDYITSQGNKNLVTIAAEAQAKSGHDILAMPTWWPHANSDLLEPVNDIMEPLIQQNGAVNGTVQYLGQLDGKWLGVPACMGSQIKGPCSRIDLMKKFAGIDVQEMYPAGSPPKADNWTTDTFLKAAEACHKGGVPFGIGLGDERLQHRARGVEVVGRAHVLVVADPPVLDERLGITLGDISADGSGFRERCFAVL